MIKLYYLTRDKGAKIYGIEDVPAGGALSIVKSYEPKFEDRAICANDLWTNDTDLDWQQAMELKAELEAEGFECEFEPTYCAVAI